MLATPSGTAYMSNIKNESSQRQFSAALPLDKDARSPPVQVSQKSILIYEFSGTHAKLRSPRLTRNLPETLPAAPVTASTA